MNCWMDPRCPKLAPSGRSPGDHFSWQVGDVMEGTARSHDTATSRDGQELLAPAAALACLAGFGWPGYHSATRLRCLSSVNRARMCKEARAGHSSSAQGLPSRKARQFVQHHEEDQCRRVCVQHGQLPPTGPIDQPSSRKSRVLRNDNKA